MSIGVEISLRIPDVKNPLQEVAGGSFSNGDVRFSKPLTVPSLPKPGDLVDLMASGVPFQATVVRAHWHEKKELFVVSCTYASRSIPRPEYLALMEDREWTRQPLWGARPRRDAPM